MKLIFSQSEGAGLPNALNRYTEKGKLPFDLKLKNCLTITQIIRLLP